MNTKLTMGRMEWLLLGLLSVLWGGSFFFARVALAEVAPLTLVLSRVVIASAALGILLRARGEALPHGKTLWATFFAMGFVNNLVPFSLLFWGQTHIGAGLASIFNSLVPVFTVLLAHVFTSDEKLTSTKIGGVLLGAAGVVVMIGIDLGKGISGWTLLAMLACIAASFSYGIASVYGRRFAKLGIAPLNVAFGQVTASSVMMLPLVLVVDQPWNAIVPGTTSILAAAALGLFSTALAYVLFFRILARGGATNISLVTLLIPVSAILLGAVFLNETLSTNHIAGMLLILLGLVALDGRTLRALKRRKTVVCTDSTCTAGSS
ncbi:MAG: DMT family transporter [Gammaproteobacteria bacterium]